MREGLSEWTTTWVIKTIGEIGETNSSVCAAMTQYSKDHKQEELSPFSSIKTGFGFKGG